jgi:hypothetical protein
MVTLVLSFEIPLTPTPQLFSVQLGTTTYNMTLLWRDDPEQGWVLDIADSQDNPIVSGIPLVTGADLLAQYEYLNFGGQLIVQSDSDPLSVPTFTNLGQTSHLYWAPNS